MNLKECLQQLSYGELSNTAWAESGTGIIRPDKVPATVQFINEALLRLYSRFPLKKSGLKLEMSDWITKYILSREHAWTNQESKAEKYIFDTPAHPFQDDIIKVMQVIASEGHELPLNNPMEEWSVFTPAYNVLEIAKPLHTVVLTVNYQAKHPLLTPENLEAEIELPFVLEGALKAYVAYQYYAALNTQESVANAQKNQSIYQSIVAEALEQDLISATFSQTNTKFRRNGWV